jgi:hypothetical protein
MLSASVLALPTRRAIRQAAKPAPANAGLECITLLNDGRLLLISEDMKRGPHKVAAWIGVPNHTGHTWQDVAYPIVGRFRPSDATTLPDGDVVVQERSYTAFEGVPAAPTVRCTPKNWRCCKRR